MSHRGFQAALVRLYLDDAIRESVRLGDTSALDALELTRTELTQLQQLVNQSDRLEFFCGILGKKQSSRVKALIPTFHRILGDNWEHLWSEYKSQMYREGDVMDETRAREFISFLTSRQLRLNANQEHLRTIARFEQFRLDVAAAVRSDRYVGPLEQPQDPPSPILAPLIYPHYSLETFPIDVATLVTALNRGQTVPQLRHEETTVLFFWHWRLEQVATARISRSLSGLLDYFNGLTSLKQLTVLLDATDRQSPPSIAKQLLSCVEFLRVRGVLRYVTPPDVDEPSESNSCHQATSD